MKVIKLLHDMSRASTNWFTTHHLQYKEDFKMTKSIYNPFFLQQSCKLIFLLGVLSGHIFKFATYHLYYKEKLEMIKSIYNLFLLRQSSKLILLFYVSYDYIVKIIKLLYHEIKAGKYLFAVDYLYYKKKLQITNTTYNSSLCYSSDKLRTITFLY